MKIWTDYLTRTVESGELDGFQISLAEGSGYWDTYFKRKGHWYGPLSVDTRCGATWEEMFNTLVERLTREVLIA